MRFNARGRAKLVATASAVARGRSVSPAAAATTAAAVATDDDEVTIWMSLDQPVIDGIQKQVDIRAEDEGITVKIERVDAHRQADQDLDRLGRHPRHRHCSPSRAWSRPSWSSARRSRSTTCSTPTSSRPTWSPGRSTPAWWTTSSTALLTVDERQVAALLPQEGLRGGRLRGAADPRRADRARRPDQGRRRHAVVPDHGVRRRHRLGRHRLVRGPGHALRRRRLLQRLGLARGAVQRRHGHRRPASTSRASSPPRATSTAAARPSPRRRSPTRPGRCSTRAGPRAGCSSRARSSWARTSCPRRSTPTSTRSSASPASRRPRPVARTRSWVAATSPSCSATTRPPRRR